MSIMSLFFILIVGEASATDRAACQAEEATTEFKLFISDFAWGQAFANMLERYNRIYHSGKRLARRAYWDSTRGRYLLPHVSSGRTVAIDDNFIGAIRTHIEKALRRKYADAIFFSDMGHAHLLIPTNKIQYYLKLELADAYEQVLADNEVHFLYHTAEQVDTSGNDARLIWRRFNRNLVGENRPGGEVYVEAGFHEPGHTLRDVAGYSWWAAGFSISASRDACFPFTMPDGSTSYFDLSLYDPDGSSYVTE